MGMVEPRRNIGVVVAVAILLVVVAGGVESSPGSVWRTGSTTSGVEYNSGDVVSGVDDYLGEEFVFEERDPPVLGGGETYGADQFGNDQFDDGSAYGANAVDTFDNAGYGKGDAQPVAEMGVMSSAPGGHGEQGFVTTSGAQFVVNGKRLFVNGVNLYYLMSYAAQPQSRGIVTEILRESASVGVTVVRTWAFADGDGAYNLQMRPGVYSEQTFRGLDYAVAEARKFGIRLILSFVNNYPDYGGRAQYAKWAQQYGHGGANPDDFYSNGLIRQWYKNHIRRVVTRLNTFTGVVYRDDPTIFSWELINEPRCESDRSGQTFQRWIREMAVYVKSLDRKHMLEVGLEGFYSAVVNPSSVNSEAANPASYTANFGTDFIMNHQPAEIDFATVHSYPDSWVSSRSEYGKRSFMASWIKTHINDAKYRLRKPVLFAEFGRSDRAPGYSLRTRINDMTDMFNAVYASASTGGPAAGSLVWQFLPPALQTSNQDGYGIVLSQSPAIASIVSKQSYRMSRL